MIKNSGAVSPGALRAPTFRRFLASCHLYPLTIYKSIGDLAPGLVQVPPRCLPGNPESLCRLFLFKPFQINEPDQLDLIGLQ